ncbi:MAG: ParB/RepB/Spo0J family partition protein [Lachnospiraceae bacterium]|nr:ParB/RepB/Spo0J family partition protein [Lachnospiraceae bacterium]
MSKDKKDCSLGIQQSAIESKKNNFQDKIINIGLNELVDFKEHPFKVEINTELYELMESIEKDGVLVPLLARTNPNGKGYELISGHRRKMAFEWAGINEVPVIVRELDDCQAVIAMVDSNLQREHIKPSEKAFAYKMKLEAMKRQGKRNDLTLSQVGTKLGIDNPTLCLHEIKQGVDEEGNWLIKNTKNERADERLSKQIGESRNQIARYIRLTNLIPKILDMVDEGKIAFTVAVEISFLNEEEQYELYTVMDMEQCTPSLSQANRLKRLSQHNRLDIDEIYNILEEEKPNQREQIKITSDTLNKYFPSDYSEKQKVELIEELVKQWHKEQVKSR